MISIRINKTITSSSLEIKELQNFIGKNVEIIVRERSNDSTGDTNERAAGMLKEYQDPKKADREQEAWKML